MGFTQLFTGVMTILGTLIFMLSVNVTLTLVVVVVTPVSFVMASFVAKKSYHFFKQQFGNSWATKQLYERDD